MNLDERFLDGLNRFLEEKRSSAHRLLHGIELVLGKHSAMGKIETETIRGHQGPCLLDMLPEDIAELAMEKMGCRMISCDIHSTLSIHDCPDWVVYGWPAFHDTPAVYDQSLHRLPHADNLDLPPWLLFLLDIPGKHPVSDTWPPLSA